ncbi:hypothetical protein SERLA73DRAFT_134927 [Serpula lacrymans var. lacrymans S7.3]|uniref:Uncharacterized protein n=1 Tax=Serpula lacrymans var. lacrymans (strain S7.3) TaxID=936435 RepID=F8PTZ3_SERL3|nr:hypothetical protein SERLA73DRAFT_134927 [Serpula lacrymans var. lacrymans S7.3]
MDEEREATHPSPPPIQLHMYCATKTAAENARNLATGLTGLSAKVNDPDKADGFIARSKGLIPAERHGNEEDAVAAVTYFSSRAGSYVSGNTLRLNGGLLVDG